jgi:protein-tyrosine phosphatase
MSSLRVMFVCSGNICRSPMAAGWARSEFDARGVDARVVSGGTLGIVGKPAASFGQLAMEEKGIDISEHYSQGIQPAMAEAADWVVVMSPRHEQFLMQHLPHLADRLVRMWEYAPSDLDQISDPVGQDVEAFRACRDLLEECVKTWIEEILEERISR